MQQEIYQSARILIIDDEAANVLLLEHILQEWGYVHIKSSTDPHQTLPFCHDFRPHIIMLDLMMPYLDGFAVMEQLHVAHDKQIRPSVLVLTADISTEVRRRALAAGARDFLTKPFDAVELSLRLSHLLEISFLHEQLHQHNQILEARVTERAQQLEKLEHETAACLGIAGDYRDDQTGRHTHRVGAASAVLARQCGLSSSTVDLMLQAAPLHDVGKIGIPDSILLKPGRLTPEEFRIMQTHCVIGQSILARHNTPLLQFAASIAISHHERWDGTGYPHGLSEENIPIEGRIVAIADVFDALTHDRPYKEAWPVEKAVAEIQAQASSQFDSQIVEIFTQNLDAILEARREYRS